MSSLVFWYPTSTYIEPQVISLTYHYNSILFHRFVFSSPRFTFFFLSSRRIDITTTHNFDTRTYRPLRKGGPNDQPHTSLFDSTTSQESVYFVTIFTFLQPCLQSYTDRNIFQKHSRYFQPHKNYNVRISATSRNTH